MYNDVRFTLNGKPMVYTGNPLRRLLDVLREDYIRTAYSKGNSRGRVMRVHAMKNALIPTVTIIGMQFLEFFDFLTNTVMMPIAAIATCLLVSRVIGVEKIEAEVTADGAPFKRKKIFAFMIRFLCPVFAAIILISSIANAFGWISM